MTSFVVCKVCAGIAGSIILALRSSRTWSTDDIWHIENDSVGITRGVLQLQYKVTGSLIDSCLLIVYRQVEFKGFLSSLSSRGCLT